MLDSSANRLAQCIDSCLNMGGLGGSVFHFRGLGHVVGSLDVLPALGVSAGHRHEPDIDDLTLIRGG